MTVVKLNCVNIVTHGFFCEGDPKIAALAYIVICQYCTFLSLKVLVPLRISYAGICHFIVSCSSYGTDVKCNIYCYSHNPRVWV